MLATCSAELLLYMHRNGYFQVHITYIVVNILKYVFVNIQIFVLIVYLVDIFVLLRWSTGCLLSYGITQCYL